MRLVIFDCDGTLIDSQHGIIAAMEYAFATVGLPAPTRGEVLGIVGLSLPEAFAALAGQHPASVRAELARLYRGDFARARQAAEPSEPLYQGVREAVEALACADDVVLGIATGKSRRGVARLLARERWHNHFLTVQTADDHPSKPHPSMLLRALAEAGVEAGAAVMVGDTSFDMQMAVSAGVGALGVAWGYHTRASLSAGGAQAIVEDGSGLLAAIAQRLQAQQRTLA